MNYTPPAEKKTEAWVKNEAIKRVDAEEIAQNNKRETANFFHQLQEEIDFIVNACIHPEEHHGEDEVHESVNKILEGIDALHDTIDSKKIYMCHNGNIPNVKGFDTHYLLKFIKKSNKNTIVDKFIELIETIPAAYSLIIF